jgi:hypothetical protein
MKHKHAFVAAHKTVYPIAHLCRVVGIARSWFYGFVQSQPARDQRQKLRTDRDADLLAKIKAAFSQSKKRYGSKRVHQDLIADGAHVSERRVATIMRKNRISPRLCKRRKPRTTDSNHSLKPSPNLLEQRFDCPAWNARTFVCPFLSSTPPSKGCCDDRLNPPNTLATNIVRCSGPRRSSDP